MAISFVDIAFGDSTNGGNATLTLPTMQQNDLVIVAYGIGDNDGVDFTMSMVTAGYTTVADLFADDAQDTNLGVFYKFMGATPDTTAEVDGQGGSDAAVAAFALVFRGVDTTTPMDVAATTATGINTANPNPPSINHNNPAGVWIVTAFGSGHNRGASGGQSYTVPAGYQNQDWDHDAIDTSDISVGINYRNSGVGDPEDPGTFTLFGTDTTSDSWCAVTMALRPAAASTETLEGDTGSYSLSGSTMTPVISMPGDTGSYSLSGSNISVTSILAASTGGYNISGSEATFSQALVLLGDSGSYSLSGSEVLFTLQLAGASGLYNLTGSDAVFSIAAVLQAESGAYTLEGNTAQFDLVQAVEGGVYNVIGSQATFVNSMLADLGSYIITGSTAEFEGTAPPVLVVRTTGMLAAKHIRRLMRRR